MQIQDKLSKWIPGIELVHKYPREWFVNDLIAGLSIAAVALPIGIAYAQLAGFAPVVGIYSCILPAIAYAIFGSSRQLVVNPDAAACSIVAVTVAPLAAGNSVRYMELSIVLTSLTGLLCIAGGLVGFGAIANFLSRPILTGYLNGIALTIIAGQLGSLFGFHVGSSGFFREVASAVSQLKATHLPTLLVGVGLLVLLLSLKHFLPRVPAPLIAVTLGGVVVYAFGLVNRGVAVVGEVPAGFPTPILPRIDGSEIGSLFFGAAGIALVSFCSMMTTARGFAAKNGYRINVNQDMFALGVSDLASAFSRGFVVSGADSRTAVADSAGGKTQVATLVGAAVMAVVLLFFTMPLASVPIAALAAILISSSLGLFDIASLREYYRLSKPEFRHALIAMLGVMTLGVLRGVLIAVAIALFNLLRRASRPRDAVLGVIQRNGDTHCGEGGQTIPGLIIYRFEAHRSCFSTPTISVIVFVR
jgi:high affinity sulfate transporter 1